MVSRLRWRALAGTVVLSVALLGAAGPAGAAPAPTPPPGVDPLPALTGLSLSAGDSAASLSWDPVTLEGGWVVAFAEDGGRSMEAGGSICTADATAGSCSFEGLVNGRSYDVSVVLFAGDQASPTSDVGQVIPVANPDAVAPAAPQAPSAWSVPAWATKADGLYLPLPAPADGSGPPMLVVSWTPPTDNGGSPVQSYRATAVDLASGEVAGSCEGGYYDTTCLIGNLADGASYQVAVVAVNSAGSSQPATTDPVRINASAQPPQLGEPVVSDQGDGSYLVTWSVEDAAAFPFLPFTVTSEQGDWCTTAYVVGSGEASCLLWRGEDGPPTGLKVELGITLLPDFFDKGDGPAVRSTSESPAAPAAPPATLASPPSSPAATSSLLPIAPATQELASSAPILAAPLADRSVLARPASSAAGGGGGALLLASCLLLLALALPLARRRRR